MSKAFESKCCKNAVPVSNFVKSISSYWSPQNWLQYQCPKCGKQSHLNIQGETVQFGFLDGAPGPCFIPEYSQRIPDLKFVATNKHAYISFGDIKNKVNAN